MYKKTEMKCAVKSQKLQLNKKKGICNATNKYHYNCI